MKVLSYDAVAIISPTRGEKRIRVCVNKNSITGAALYEPGEISAYMTLVWVAKVFSGRQSGDVQI